MEIQGRLVHNPFSNTYAILSNLNVDADGSPRAYAPAGSGLIGQDYLANAGYPGNWWALACDSSGTPYIQGSSDPAPGYYISTTAFEDSNYPQSDPRRYVDASSVPFVVIPSSPHFGVSLGHIGFGFNLTTGDSTAFMVGDIGPDNQFGEASIAFAHNLNIDSNAKTGGTSSDIVGYVFFTSYTARPGFTNYDILRAAADCLHEKGGLDALKAALIQWDWSKFVN